MRVKIVRVTNLFGLNFIDRDPWIAFKSLYTRHQNLLDVLRGTLALFNTLFSWLFFLSNVACPLALYWLALPTISDEICIMSDLRILHHQLICISFIVSGKEYVHRFISLLLLPSSLFLLVSFSLSLSSWADWVFPTRTYTLAYLLRGVVNSFVSTLFFISHKLSMLIHRWNYLGNILFVSKTRWFSYSGNSAILEIRVSSISRKLWILDKSAWGTFCREFNFLR